jgi:hypothetical protein
VNRRATGTSDAVRNAVELKHFLDWPVWISSQRETEGGHRRGLVGRAVRERNEGGCGESGEEGKTTLYIKGRARQILAGRALVVEGLGGALP